MDNIFKNKILLITGGTGSFGQAVLKHFVNTNIKEIRIFSRDEKKQDDLKKKYHSDKIKYYIGDIKDYNSLEDAMMGCDYVFHAAAIKEVPTCEDFPLEAVKTNILGTNNVIESAIKHNIKKVIVLSTDKAVYPISAMGMSKSLMEKMVLAKCKQLGNNSTIICITRFGNLLASRGSVVPYFISEIRNNSPLTITDPNMERFIMTLEDAVNLVVYAYKNGNQSDIFVLKCPYVKLNDLALSVKRFMKSDVEIKVIGKRPGEKIRETLVTGDEMRHSHDLGKYFCINSKFMNNNASDFCTNNSKKLSVDEIIMMLNEYYESKNEV